MVGKLNPPALVEHGKLIGLLADYEDYLLHKYVELLNEEAPQSEINKCNREIESVSAALRIIKKHFSKRLQRY